MISVERVLPESSCIRRSMSTPVECGLGHVSKVARVSQRTFAPVSRAVIPKTARGPDPAAGRDVPRAEEEGRAAVWGRKRRTRRLAEGGGVGGLAWERGSRQLGTALPGAEQPLGDPAFLDIFGCQKGVALNSDGPLLFCPSAPQRNMHQASKGKPAFTETGQAPPRYEPCRTRE